MTNAQRLEILIDYAEGLRYTVDLDDPGPLAAVPFDLRNIDENRPGTRVITLDASQPRASLVYALLHELGHVHEGAHGVRLFNPDAYGRRSWVGRCATIESEILAWRLGWDIAVELKLGLSPKAYEREAARWVRRYVLRGGLTAYSPRDRPRRASSTTASATEKPPASGRRGDGPGHSGASPGQ